MTITYTQLGKCGRLGNMLFQIAATIGTAKKNNTDFIFPRWEYESAFNLHNCFSDSIIPNRTYTEPFFQYVNPNIVNDCITDLSGYFQSYKYWNHCEPYIKFIFESIYQERMIKGATSVHIRRGDYITLGNGYYINLAATDYYDNAISAANSDRYFIFSDDIDWCRSKFRGPQFKFIDEKDPTISMSIMSACENNVIANSSFSWWGAYLNKNPDKKVIAPAKWFGPALPHNTRDLLPETWIKI